MSGYSFPNGVAAFNETIPASMTTAEFVSSTATDTNGNTSEFSANVAVQYDD